MKNTSERIRIINIFRKYSRLGLASGRLDPIDAYERIRGCCRCREEALELLAVYDTIRLLAACGKKDCLDALVKIYFPLSQRSISKREISERVIRYAYDNHCDERTVYRRLSYAVGVYRMLKEDRSFRIR